MFANHSKYRDELRHLPVTEVVITGKQLTKAAPTSTHKYKHLSIIANLAV